MSALLSQMPPAGPVTRGVQHGDSLRCFRKRTDHHHSGCRGSRARRGGQGVQVVEAVAISLLGGQIGLLLGNRGALAIKVMLPALPVAVYLWSVARAALTVVSSVHLENAELEIPGLGHRWEYGVIGRLASPFKQSKHAVDLEGRILDRLQEGLIRDVK